MTEPRPAGNPGAPHGGRALSEGALLDMLAQIDPGSPFYRHAAPLLDERLVRNPRDVPTPTPRGPRRLLTIGMATYDDYDGAYFSVQAIRLYHPEVTDRTEILVLDNHPTGPAARLLKDLENSVVGYRYVPYGRRRGNWVRDLLFREASGDFVLCMDSHVFFRPGALQRLVEYLEARPDTRDLLQGPLMGDSLMPFATHFDPVWRTGMYGIWATDPRGLDPEAPPFEIPMQGVGVFACRREAWPGYDPRLEGFGLEEGYLHEKIRRGGGRVLCLPFLAWLHRFGRPAGPPYTISVEDRVRNHILSCVDLGIDPGAGIEHFEREFGVELVRSIVDRVEREVGSPFHFFDAIYCINLDRETGRWERMLEQCRALGIERRVRRFPAIDTPSAPGIGRVLSHRAVIAEARWQGLDNVLVLEDDAVLSPRLADVLAPCVAGLRSREWGILSLGGGASDADDPAGSCLRPAPQPLPLHATAYHRSVYDRIVADVPPAPTGVARWLRAHTGLGHYLAQQFAGVSVAACVPGAVPSPDGGRDVASHANVAVSG